MHVKYIIFYIKPWYRVYHVRSQSDILLLTTSAGPLSLTSRHLSVSTENSWGLTAVLALVLYELSMCLPSISMERGAL